MKNIFSLLASLVACVAVQAAMTQPAGRLFAPQDGPVVVGEETQSGMCGDSVMWMIADNVLTISGSGAMGNFTDEAGAPYGDYQYLFTSVVVEEGVTAIGAYAFSGYMNLTELTIMGELQSIGANAFYYCNALTSITSWATNPPALANTTVFYAVPATATVYVPSASIEAYRAAQGWNAFRDIRPIPEPEEPNVVTIFGVEVVIDDSTAMDTEVDIFGDSTLVYNTEDNTLTFSSLNLEVGDSVSTAISYSGSDPLTIVLCDSSVIFADTVIASTADIIIKGEGTLIAEGVRPIVGVPTASIKFDSVSMYVRSVPSPAALRRRIRGIKQTDEDGGPALSGFASADFNKTSVTPPEAEYGDVEETDEVSGITVTYKALYVSNPDGSKSALTEFTLTPIEGWDALENTQSPATLDPTKPMYNILGMPVEPGYKGIVVQGGRKFVVL